MTVAGHVYESREGLVPFCANCSAMKLLPSLRFASWTVCPLVVHHTALAEHMGESERGERREEVEGQWCKQS